MTSLRRIPFRNERHRRFKNLLALKAKLFYGLSLTRGYRSCIPILIVATCLGSSSSYGQSPDSDLRVPVVVLPMVTTGMQMRQPLGYYVADGRQTDALAHYQRSRLGRWKVPKDVDPEDGVFGIELETPARTIRIRCETTINGQPFRAMREKTINELMAIANGTAEFKEENVEEDRVEEDKIEEEVVEAAEEVKAQPQDDADEADADAADADELAEPPEKKRTVPPLFVGSSDMVRMASYARSRGDQLTRRELRRRVADIAGGPALMRTTSDFGAQRNETMTLFALLDDNEDGVISPEEQSVAVDTLNFTDANVDGQLTMEELHLGLKSRSAQRDVGFTKVQWQSWNAIQSPDSEDINVHVSFSDDGENSNLKIDDCRLNQPWDLMKVDVQPAKVGGTRGSAVMLSHPKVAVALSAVQSDDKAHRNADQISVGVTLESNSLFRELDKNGDGSLNSAERSSFDEVIALLDDNASGTLEASEVPVLLRVCVARGAIAHEVLSGSVSITRQSDVKATKQKGKLVPPDWFASMDKDGDQMLTRDEFLGGRKSFSKMDADKNDLLSVEEGLAEKLD